MRTMWQVWNMFSTPTNGDTLQTEHEIQSKIMLAVRFSTPTNGDTLQTEH